MTKAALAAASMLVLASALAPAMAADPAHEADCFVCGIMQQAVAPGRVISF